MKFYFGLIAATLALACLAGCTLGDRGDGARIPSDVEEAGLIQTAERPMVSLTQPDSAPANTQVSTPNSDKQLTVDEIFGRMIQSIESTPVLHLTVMARHKGATYEAQGWMTASKALCEVRFRGSVVFARYTDRKRVQEYAPNAKFGNGTVADHVLLEYDAATNTKSGDWPRLKDTDFGCGPGFIAADRYIGEHALSFPRALFGVMKEAKMTETEFAGKPCYWFTLETSNGSGSLTWNLYLDKTTCEPVRQTRVDEKDGKRVKDEMYDYTFEHLANEDGIHWGLELSRLKSR